MIRNDLRKVRNIIATCLEMAQELELSHSAEKPRGFCTILAKGRVLGLKEALMMIDGYETLKGRKSVK